jgi:anti-sigma B factor antagonist
VRSLGYSWSVPVSTDLEQLTVSCTETAGHVRVDVAGDLDAYNSIHLRRVLDDLIRARVAAITVDLSGVTFIDSGGLGLLVFSQRTAYSNGVSLWVDQPSRVVTRLMTITGTLTRLVSQAPPEDAA